MEVKGEAQPTHGFNLLSGSLKRVVANERNKNTIREQISRDICKLALRSDHYKTNHIFFVSNRHINFSCFFPANVSSRRFVTKHIDSRINVASFFMFRDIMFVFDI